MFNFFSKNKFEIWENELLIFVFNHISNCDRYANQLRDGIVRKVHITADNTFTTVNFFYNTEVVKKYENRRMPQYQIEGIKVFDQLSSKYVDLAVFLAGGLVAGYQIRGKRKISPDFARVECSKITFNSLGRADFDKIRHLFSEKELEMIVPSDVYEVRLKGKKYYHIVDTEDGDFIGIDEQKEVYKVTQDPFSITKLAERLAGVLEKHRESF